MKEPVDISSEIKQRLDAYCSESSRPFDSVLHEALCFFIREKNNGAGLASNTELG